MLATALWMLLAASGGVLSGIFYDRATSNPTPIINNRDGAKINFLQTAKIIGIITVGAVAVHFLLKMFKIKFFNKVIR